MRSTVDDIGIIHLGMDDIGADNALREEGHREHRESDGIDSPGGIQTPGAVETERERALDFPKESPYRGPTENNEHESSVGPKDSPEGFGVPSETPTQDSSMAPRVKFQKGHGEITADHPIAASNKALDSDEGESNEAVLLDILSLTGAEADATKPDDIAKGDADIGRSNKAMDNDDDEEETGF